jgi:simple sugar transport system permease protein
MDHESMITGSLMATLLVAVLRASTPILLAAVGGLLSDAAGCVNVALEGMMLVAAFFGVVTSAYAGIWFPWAAPGLAPWLGCAAGLLAALALAGLLAVCHLEWGADLIVAGIAMNILAAGATVFLLVEICGDKGSTARLASYALPSLPIPCPWDSPVLRILLSGEGGAGHHVLTYAALVSVPLAWLVLRRSAFGLRLRAVGEHKQAAVSAGVAVKRVQYAALLASGAFAGLGGIYLGMGYLTVFQADMTAGRGFLALAAVLLGGGRPLGTCAAALLFGGSTVFAARLGASGLPSQVVFMIPPLITIAALVLINYRREVGQRIGIRRAADRLLGRGDAAAESKS